MLHILSAFLRRSIFLEVFRIYGLSCLPTMLEHPLCLRPLHSALVSVDHPLSDIQTQHRHIKRSGGGKPFAVQLLSESCDRSDVIIIRYITWPCWNILYEVPIASGIEFILTIYSTSKESLSLLEWSYSCSHYCAIPAYLLIAACKWLHRWYNCVWQ